jgi:hypothetical protein
LAARGEFDDRSIASLGHFPHQFGTPRATKNAHACSTIGLAPTSNQERAFMCDYSLQHVSFRPARVGDQLTTRDFGTGTRGFCAAEDANLAVCVLPGTELSFAAEVSRVPMGLLPWLRRKVAHTMAIFRQINVDQPDAHHDALEFPDGRIVLLTHLSEGQHATVLQLPVQQKVGGVETPAPQRVAYSG